jgi:predicted PhzF superfamily epimerase YddE/YHI9
MDFPARPPEKIASSAALTEGLGMAPKEVLKSRDILAVFEDESQIRNMKPDFQVLAQVRDVLGVIVTAPGTSVDFVSRFFSPNAGLPEDPVTGSAHCTLVPYWAARLGKATLHAHQLSARGGELFCENKGERVTISGRAVCYNPAAFSR